MPTPPPPKLSLKGSTPIRPGAKGMVSGRSKTGDPACSKAASAWQLLLHNKPAGMAKEEVYKTLARCRSLGTLKKQAAGTRLAGNEGRAQHWEHRAKQAIEGKTPVTKKDRAAKAMELIQKRREARKAAAPSSPLKPSTRALLAKRRGERPAERLPTHKPEHDRAVNAWVKDSQYVSHEDRRMLAATILASKTKRPRLERVFRADPKWAAGEVIDLKPTATTGVKLSEGREAGQIGWKSKDEALAVVESPKRGFDIPYHKVKAQFSAAAEQETLIAGRYRVKEVRQITEPGTNPQYGYKVKQYVLEELPTPLPEPLRVRKEAADRLRAERNRRKPR